MSKAHSYNLTHELLEWAWNKYNQYKVKLTLYILKSEKVNYLWSDSLGQSKKIDISIYQV